MVDAKIDMLRMELEDKLAMIKVRGVGGRGGAGGGAVGMRREERERAGRERLCVVRPSPHSLPPFPPSSPPRTPPLASRTWPRTRWSASSTSRPASRARSPTRSRA